MISTVNDRHEFFQCECHDHEHLVKIDIHHWDENDVDFSMSVTADVHQPWLKRVKTAVQYILGIPGLSWHDILLQEADVDRLQSLINHYKKLKGT